MKKKATEQENAKRLRAKGWLMPEIARKLGVSKSSVHLWVSEVSFTDRGKASHEKKIKESNKARFASQHVDARVKIHKDRREAWRKEGRLQAMLGNPRHAFSCALYWGEGGKSKNDVRMCNSDISIMLTFITFLKEFFGIKNEELKVKIIGYTDCVSQEEVEKHWVNGLNIPGAEFGPHEFDTRKYITRGAIRPRSRRIKFGTCYVSVKGHPTRILQHIYGALEVYGGAKLDHHGHHPAVIRGEEARKLNLINAPVAQPGLEQLGPNETVGGSNPSGRTTSTRSPQA